MSETGNSRVEVIGSIPRGTHLCQFYHDKEELGETLVPYFEAGLSNNDMCIWITAESLGIEEARKALEQSMPDSQDSVESGQMQILDALLEAQVLIEGWRKEYNQVRQHSSLKYRPPAP